MLRPIELNTELADGFGFHVIDATIEEELSKPFTGTITLISKTCHSDYSQIVGQEMTLSFSVSWSQRSAA